MLLKTSSAKENAWKQHISQILFNKSISEKIYAFEILQNLFVISIFLVHFDFNCQLYINVNAFKQYEFSAVVYYVKNDSISIFIMNAKTVEFLCHKIQLILFFSKILMFVKRNYWFIEMKTAELIWMIHKTRHLIKSVSKNIIVFMNHSATTLIVCQTHLIITVNINKLNLQLIWTSQYFSQFNLNV